MESAPFLCRVILVFARFQLHVENHKNPLRQKLSPGIQKQIGKQNSEIRESVLVFYRNMFHALGSKTFRKNKILELWNQRICSAMLLLFLHDFNFMLKTI